MIMQYLLACLEYQHVLVSIMQSKNIAAQESKIRKILCLEGGIDVCFINS